MLLLNAQAKWLTVHLLKMQIKTKDEVVRRVLAKMDQRSLIGQEKYGATMMGEIKNEVKDLDRFLVDVQEELMDALLYICLLYTSPSPRDRTRSRMPSSA